MASEDVLERFTAKVTPGVADTYSAALGDVVSKIESEVEAKIKQDQGSTRSKLQTLYSSFTAAASAAVDAKEAADSSDEAWYKCDLEEQRKRQAIEAAAEHLTSSKSSEQAACQLQQYNKGFSFDATGKYNFTVQCDFSVPNCAERVKAFEAGTLEKIEQDAEASLNMFKAKYMKLKAACDLRREERVAAEDALSAAQSAWNSQHALCLKMSSQRFSAMCAYGTKVGSKCTAETAFSEIAAASQKAAGTSHSEVDRAVEWKVSQVTKCVVAKTLANGLQTSISAEDVNACAASVPTFESSVGGKLELHSEEFAGLAAENKCEKAPISFFDGESWKIAELDLTMETPSSLYTKVEFRPVLNPPTENFGFCH